MEFRILGSLEIWDGPRPIQISGAKRRAVLALLVLHANEVVGKDRLIDELWGEKGPPTAAASLHNHVSRLRKVLGPDTLSTRAWGYALRVDPEQIDLCKFERLITDAEPLPAKERSAKLAEALALWRGPALADLAFEPALAKEAARLEELRLTVLEARMDADLEIGRSTPLIGELEALIAEHPLRERLRGQLILALYRDGRQAEALEVYRETRRLLADELGLEPSPALRELERAILRQDPALVAAAPAPAIQDNFPGRRRWIVYGGLAAAALLVAGAIAAGVVIAPPESVQRVVSVLTYGQTTLTTANGPYHRARANAGKTRSHATATKSLAARSAVTQRRHSLPTGKNNVQSGSAPSGPSHTLPQSRTQHHSTTKSASLPRHMSLFVDTFSGSAYNARVWGGPDTLGTDVDVAQRNGELEIALHADSKPDPVYNGIMGRYWGTCNFTGDFDARVDFRLVDWPTENGARLGLLLALTGNNYVELVRESHVSGQEDYTFGSPNTPPRVVSTNDTSGAFRVTRIGSVITGYYRSGKHWVKLGSTVWEGYVKFLTDLSASGTTFPHKDVAAAFDNFTVFAPRSETCFGYPA